MGLVWPREPLISAREPLSLSLTEKMRNEEQVLLLMVPVLWAEERWRMFGC